MVRVLSKVFVQVFWSSKLLITSQGTSLCHNEEDEACCMANGERGNDYNSFPLNICGNNDLVFTIEALLYEVEEVRP